MIVAMMSGWDGLVMLMELLQFGSLLVVAELKRGRS